MMKDVKTEALVRTLERSYFVGFATFGPCPECNKSARGSDYCKTCVIAELRSRGISVAALNHFCQLLNRKINLLEKIESARAALCEDKP